MPCVFPSEALDTHVTTQAGGAPPPPLRQCAFPPWWLFFFFFGWEFQLNPCFIVGISITAVTEPACMRHNGQRVVCADDAPWIDRYNNWPPGDVERTPERQTGPSRGACIMQKGTNFINLLKPRMAAAPALVLPTRPRHNRRLHVDFQRLQSPVKIIHDPTMSACLPSRILIAPLMQPVQSAIIHHCCRFYRQFCLQR